MTENKSMVSGPGLNLTCRGRNGRFTYGSHYAWVSKDTPEDPEWGCCVEISSKRSGKSAPISISGSRSDVLCLLERIMESVKAAA